MKLRSLLWTIEWQLIYTGRGPSDRKKGKLGRARIEKDASDSVADRTQVGRGNR